MAKKRVNLEKEEKILNELAKKAIESEEDWFVVKGGTKVILINEDDLIIERIRKSRIEK